MAKVPHRSAMAEYAASAADMRHGLSPITRWASMMLLTASIFPVTVFGADLVGSIVPPYPAGTDSRNGACIGKPAETVGKEACPYSVGLLEKGPGIYTQIYAAKLSHRTEKNAFFKVTDAIPYPTVTQGYYLAFGLCRLSGENDDTVLAVVRTTDAEWHRDATWARKVDLPSGTFKKISPDNVECMNEDPGD